MIGEQVVGLGAIRTDGWFERIGESVGSFQALCDIVGERFFAFSMITGARITSLTVDRRNPDATLVDFTVGGADDEASPGDVQRLSLAEFRRRLVGALVADEPAGPPPRRATDVEATQLHIGVRFLLLAPLYGYSLLELRAGLAGSTLRLLRDGVEELHPLAAFRERIKAHVRQELGRATKGAGRGAIDLSQVKGAEEAAARGDHARVVALLGQWPAPLTIFLRTPEGQMLNPDSRALIARGLGLLGTACAEQGDAGQAEEILRLAVQYAGEGPVAGDVYARLGEALLRADRAGEAIGPLRRGANLGAPGARIWPALARAFAARGRGMAALAAVHEAQAAGVSADDLGAVLSSVEVRLGPALGRWRQLVGRDGSG